MEISKTKIDRLGDRLRKGNITDDDLRLLDEYRRSFTEAYDAVVGAIRNQLSIDPTGRPAKSTTSITEKLRRESIRLTQMQDIAGCRIVVPAFADQQRVVADLIDLFPKSVVVDRREKPSHGYRAVHVVATIDKSVEIQVRTALQQIWAELCEKLADMMDPAIKYGGGEEYVKTFLVEASRTISKQEFLESQLLEERRNLEAALSNAALTDEERAAIMIRKEKALSYQATSETLRDEAFKVLRATAAKLQE